MKKLLALIPAALTALLLWSAYAPMNESCAIVFALVPMLVISRFCTPKRSLVLWTICGLLFWVATLSWMPAIIKNNGPWPLVILGWFGLGTACALFFSAFGWLTARAWQAVRMRGDRAGETLLVLLVVEPFVWAGLEWCRSVVPFGGFAWNYLGTAVGGIPSFAAPARLGGVYFVSALVVLLNGVFATLACRLIRQIRREVEPTFGTPTRTRLVRALETGAPLLLILASFYLAGACVPTGEARPLKIALVQRNAPCIFKPQAKPVNPYDVFDNMLSTATVAKPDLVVWGESAMAEFRTSLNQVRAKEVARHYADLAGGAALLAGGDWWFSVETPAGEVRRAQNGAALFVVSPTNVAVQAYGKQHLVPFGEYIPCDKLIPILQKLSPIGISLWPGEAKTLDLNGIKLAPLICFEDTDPTLARKAARLGAQAIVLITNDSWFSFSHEAEQHAQQAVLRAIETGIPVIRVGNSGVTGLISPSGRTRWLEDGEGKLLIDAAGTMLETVYVPVSPKPTPYTCYGDIPLLILFSLLFVGLCFVPTKPELKLA
ncbi:MAG: apolipoprotein N-acyltransferase [Kiritimatiellae bacterium]|nr:apolipoprotein N-acyltransferase [Kiritimatiellia bacterium]